MFRPSQRNQPNQLAKPGTVTTLKLGGYTARVKTVKLLQYRQFSGFPDRPWNESLEAQQQYEYWMRRTLPFIDCVIDREALTQLRAEMDALEVKLPEDDKLVWVAYVLCGNVEDLFSIVRALTPKVG